MAHALRHVPTVGRRERAHVRRAGREAAPRLRAWFRRLREIEARGETGLAALIVLVQVVLLLLVVVGVELVVALAFYFGWL